MIKEFLWGIYKAPLKVKLAFLILSALYLSIIVWGYGSNTSAEVPAVAAIFFLIMLVIADLIRTILVYFERK